VNVEITTSAKYGADNRPEPLGGLLLNSTGQQHDVALDPPMYLLVALIG